MRYSFAKSLFMCGFVYWFLFRLIFGDKCPFLERISNFIISKLPTWKKLFPVLLNLKSWEEINNSMTYVNSELFSTVPKSEFSTSVYYIYVLKEFVYFVFVFYLLLLASLEPYRQCQLLIKLLGQVHSH